MMIVRNLMGIVLAGGIAIAGSANDIAAAALEGAATVSDVVISRPIYPISAVAPVRVVTSLPIYAYIAREVGGSEVQVTSIAEPSQDAHFVQPKPSFALELRRADLFVTTGLDLELWVPALLDRAGNAAVVPGGPGYVSAHTGIDLVDVPASVDRSAGDIHIYGNPHIYTDPLNIAQIARNIASGLKKVAPDRAATFDAGLAAFTDQIHRRLFGDELVEMLGGATLENLARQGNLMGFLAGQTYEGAPLSNRLGGWLAAAAPFRNKQMICYHKDWAYFERLFQVTCTEFIEAKPGIPPTPRHVSRIIDLMRGQGLKVILTPTYYDRSRSDAVANRVGGTVVVVPMQPIIESKNGGTTRTYFDVVDNWVSSLARAFQAS